MRAPIRALYVDPDPTIGKESGTRADRADGSIEIVSETHAQRALGRLKTERSTFDCVISEYDLPDMNGLEFLERVRTERPAQPFILYTDGGSEEIAWKATRAGVTEYLPKTRADQFAEVRNRVTAVVEQAQPSASISTRAELRELADTANDALWMFAADWSELIFVNDAVESIFGLPIERLRENPERFREAIHPDDRDRAVRVADRLSSGESADVELRVNETEDYDRWVWVQAEPIVTDGGAVERIVGFARDITDRKTRERALQELNAVGVDLDALETVQAICERSIEASDELLQFDLSVIDIEEDGILSKAAVSDDVAPANTTALPITEGIAGKTYRTGESFLIDDLEIEPDATPQGPFRSAISIPIGGHGVFQAVDEDPGAFDETDLELAELLVSHTSSALDRLDREQQLRHQNERLEEFTRIVSHDLRNPMNVVDGSLELAREECDSDHLANASEALDRMETIVEETLTLAREGQVVGEMEPVRLETVANVCWENLATESASLDVATAAKIRADPDRLSHIFENLFRNAIEHGGTTVSVHVGRTGDGFYVEDDGPGIPEAKRDDVFTPGYTDAESSGFGLTIVRQVAEAHGWTVRVDDGRDGGTRFAFSDVDVLD